MPTEYKSGRNQPTFGDNASIDSFGRLRTSNPHTLYDHQFQYGKGSLFWNEKITGSASSSHLPSESSILMTVNNTNDEIIRQSKRYSRYVPGKSQLIYFTFVMGQSADGVRKRVGYFDSNNGIFLEQNGSALSWNIRSKTNGSVVDTKAYSEDWNIEKYIELDNSKSQIGVMDIEWLGVGRVRVGFVKGGKIIYTHEFLHTNILDKVYMTTANLPIRYELKRTSGSGESSLKQICCSVSSEGGYEKRGLSFSASNSTSGKTLSARTPLLSIRPKTTFNSIENRILIEPKNLQILATGNPVFFEIIYNGTLNSSSFSNVDANSSVEYDTSATSISGGTLIKSGYIGAGVGGSAIVSSDDFLNKLVLGLDIDGLNPDMITVVATNIGNNPVCYSAIEWLESQD